MTVAVKVTGERRTIKLTLIILFDIRRYRCQSNTLQIEIVYQDKIAVIVVRAVDKFQPVSGGTDLIWGGYTISAAVCARPYHCRQ